MEKGREENKKEIAKNYMKYVFRKYTCKIYLNLI